MYSGWRVLLSGPDGHAADEVFTVGLALVAGVVVLAALALTAVLG